MNIAILGGTFDPIHNGHLALARSVVQVFDIDELHFVPAFAPPHKAPDRITSPFHRFAMVALAAGSEDRYRVSPIEADSLGRRYSVDTLRLMRQAYPQSRLLFLTGTDTYREIQDWKAYRELFELASFAVARRPGFPMLEGVAPFRTLAEGDRVSLERDPKVYYLPWVDQDTSSTHIRDAAARGEDLASDVPPDVARYIRRHRLYRIDHQRSSPRLDL